jgi:hypothetical protein
MSPLLLPYFILPSFFIRSTDTMDSHFQYRVNAVRNDHGLKELNPYDVDARVPTVNGSYKFILKATAKANGKD